MTTLIPVILSGGAGTRLWPVSREDHPKPFLRLPDGQSLLGKAYARAGALLPTGGDIITVTNREHFFTSRDYFAEAGLTAAHHAHYLLEPVGRNTAAAIACAALAAQASHGDNAILVVMAADHLIADTPAFVQASTHAAQWAAQGHLVTYGITPTSAHTGFGYIEKGAALDSQGANQVLRFVEKPDQATAEQYLQSGRFLWNSGMFCFAVGTLLAQLQQHAPQVLEQAVLCMQHSPSLDSSGCHMQELERSSFEKIPDISIDYALMERSQQVAVIAATFDWSDIGCWSAMAQLTPTDKDSNRIQGDALLVDTRNTFIQSDNRLVATVGVDNLVIVDTPDALLVAHADRAQDVREVAKRLKHKRHDAHRLHRTVNRPWGSYTVLEEGSNFKIKRIVVKPGASLSLQMHHHRSEHWVVVQGMARVVNGCPEPRLVNTNESTFIPAGHQHRLHNPGVIELIIIEVQSGSYLGEDDIVRLEDQYGRAAAAQPKPAQA